MQEVMMVSAVDTRQSSVLNFPQHHYVAVISYQKHWHTSLRFHGDVYRISDDGPICGRAPRMWHISLDVVISVDMRLRRADGAAAIYSIPGQRLDANCGDLSDSITQEPALLQVAVAKTSRIHCLQGSQVRSVSLIGDSTWFGQVKISSSCALVVIFRLQPDDRSTEVDASIAS